MTRRRHAPTRGARRRTRQLSAEPLEPRCLLSAAGLIEVGSQPSGALDDKIVYVHGGHGYTAANTGSGSWSTQRPLLHRMVEDMGNQDQLTFLAEYLFNAGATVVPLRPVGHQPNEVIVDNDDPGVTFTGAWSNSSSSIYFGDPGDVPYRFASTSATETATARYQPDIPEEGFYPVYAWTRYGSDRAADQLYKVQHAGGTTEVTINHRRVGNGPIYLGTYYFEAGTGGHVEISNRSSELGRVVIADMIRFGNGVGDINRGGGVSGFDREDEAGLYWIQWHVDNSQGVLTSEYRVSGTDSSATVSASPRYAEYMNREADGSLSDRVFVSFHSNAGGGRGVVALHNTNQGGATPNQLLLAQTLGQEVNDDLVAQNGSFEHNWSDRGSNVTFQTSFNFGEINNSVIGSEFDATIVETGFHDSQLDAELLRDPKVRDALARATYQGIVNYFNAVDGGATANIDLPGVVSDLRAEATAEGEVTLSWTGPEVNSFSGGAPTGFMVYASTNGYGFDGGRLVAGGGAASHTITGLDPDETYYFKVAAVNAGGEAPDSEVVAAKASAAGQSVLIVNGFDRTTRQQNPEQTFFQGGQLERVRPRQNNSFDYAVQMATAIDQAAAIALPGGVTIDTAANEAVISGDVLLTDYDAVFWVLGEESSADDTFDSTEQTRVQEYLLAGGDLFVSGAEIGWDLDNLGGGPAFYNNTLKADFVADDANTYQVQGVAGSIFAGLNFAFDDGSQFYDTEFADVIIPTGGSLAALNYAGGGGAAVQHSEGDQRLVMLAFPFETITTEADRRAVMQRVLEFFDTDDGVPRLTTELIIDNDDPPPGFLPFGPWFSGPKGDGSTFLLVTLGDTAVAEWRADVPLAGDAQVFVRHVAAPNRATGAFFEAESGEESVSGFINQQENDDQWVFLGSLPVEAGEMVVRLSAATSTGDPFTFVIADGVRIIVSSPIVPSGDFNDDGVVDTADFTVWRDELGQSVDPGAGADANFDGVVDTDDYLVWREQFGTTPAPSGGGGSAANAAAPLSDEPLADEPLADDSAASLATVPAITDERRSATQPLVDRGLTNRPPLRSTLAYFEALGAERSRERLADEDRSIRDPETTDADSDAAFEQLGESLESLFA